MQRVFLALLFVALAAVLFAALARSVSRISDWSRQADAVDFGGAMPKVSFFLLICLMAYVSLSGGS